METVAGKKVLITGAAMGMGKLYAELAVREKAGAVVLWDVNQAALDATVTELKAAGGTVFAYVVDVSNLEDIEKNAAQVQREIGDIDLLFNNAGIIRGKYFWDHDNRRDIWMTMAVNSLAIMYIARAFIPAMIAGGRQSRIVNIASAAGTVSNPRMSVYCASKWAAIGWSDSLRLELEQAGHRHVKVTTVMPSYISTGMFEGVKAPLMTPILRPQVVVDKVWAAMKIGKAQLTLPWTVRLAMLSRGLLPLAVWDFIADKVFHIYSSMDHFQGGRP
ncbi:MAG: 3-oxoacyl-ACP reductase [Hydrocarboniphaga sp.]|uniref:SDR family oxidoreductase n=1 Tax=Hydrocarboniphaga sp. TaxID=2033016 RepID=UPI0026354CF3|nr:SDR family oxidoreductase [Hydrocarboniphaga sp.]MDB5972130.1 3-oxoacyl-ACP reductase [Hydrocarboniphaga sp.]